MGERERFKNILKKVIDDTENDKITTSEELIQTLIYEIKNTSSNKKVTENKTIHSQSFAN